MKPMFEKVLPCPDSSWRYWIYDLNFIEFNWHYHPEYEIAVTLDSEGKRYVGDSVEDYSGIDMALLGPSLPHTWHTKAKSPDHIQRTYIAQLPTSWLDWLVKTMPEMNTLQPLLETSKRGVWFTQEVASQCADIFAAMEHEDTFTRLIQLLEIFKLMINDKGSRPLSSTSYTLSLKYDSSTDRIDKVVQYIHEHYTENLNATQLAKYANMSTSHFHRFIKQRTERTFTELVTEKRIGKACSLLINSDLPVSVISDLCGFNNLSNFNRRFSQIKKMTPSSFRKEYSSKGPLLQNAS